MPIPENQQQLACMQLWGGNQRSRESISLEGIDAWVYSNPYAGSDHGGDIHYMTSCATGRITRIVIADISGHGEVVADFAIILKQLMHRYINYISQEKFARDINNHFCKISERGQFATAIIMTHFAPTGELTFCNAGHPSPLVYRNNSKTWHKLEQEILDEQDYTNVPFGIVEDTDYRQNRVTLGEDDIVLLFTDALMEALMTSSDDDGLELLKQMLDKINVTDPDKLMESIIGSLLVILDEDMFTDDMTILVLSPKYLYKLALKNRLKAPVVLTKAIFSALFSKERKLPRLEFDFQNLGGLFLDRLNRKKKP